jgi:pyruvate kinase
MDYEIVATLGPSSDAEEMWSAMLLSGVTAFRLNTSHLTLEQLDSWLARLSQFQARLDQSPPIVLDLQGSKWRLGQFAPFDLVPGQFVQIRRAASSAESGVLPAPHPDLFLAAPLSSGELVLDDARVRLVVERVGEEVLRARVIQGGRISPHKGITFTASEYRKEALNEKDQAILEKTRGLDSVRYALSYVRDAAEMGRYREQFGPAAWLIAKLERGPAIEDAAKIAARASEIWLCRGDLGAELGMQTMAEAVNRFSIELGSFRIPVLLAGQVLEHMTQHPAPTRSEICYLYDALARGYTGIVLSDETAVGLNPLESCRAAALFKARDRESQSG